MWPASFGRVPTKTSSLLPHTILSGFGEQPMRSSRRSLNAACLLRIKRCYFSEHLAGHENTGRNNDYANTRNPGRREQAEENALASPPARRLPRRVLARLLELNEQRAQEERLAGKTADAKEKKTNKRARKKKTKTKSDTQQMALLDATDADS